MMKKLIALMLSLMLLAAVAIPAMAEDTAHKHTVVYDDSLSVQVVIPEGYAVEEANVNGVLLLILTPLDEGKNYFCTLIAPDEDRAGVERLNDLSEEELTELAAELCSDLNNPTVTYSETGMGTKLMVIDDNDVEEGDTAAIVTLYKGYFLTTYIFPVGDTVTDAEKEMAIQFYTDMEFLF